jgi:hypothetical protein
MIDFTVWVVANNLRTSKQKEGVKLFNHKVVYVICETNSRPEKQRNLPCTLLAFHMTKGHFINL